METLTYQQLIQDLIKNYADQHPQKDNKFWIQRDFTEAGIASQLLKAGVSKENIVLGFRSPFNRL